MNIVVINGNSSIHVSDGIERAALQAALPGTQIRVLTPETGPATIEGYLDGQLSALAVCEEIAAHRHEADAFVIACFSDPGLYAAREITQKPVVGIAEASMVTALQLGHRFGLLTPLRRLKPVLEDLVYRTGFRDRLACVQTVDLNVAESAQVGEARLAAYFAAGSRAVEEDGAEVLILAGAVLSGMETELASRLAVPVLDPVKCGVAQAQLLVHLGLQTSHAVGFSPPRPKDCPGCSPEIGSLYEKGDESQSPD